MKEKNNLFMLFVWLSDIKLDCKFFLVGIMVQEETELMSFLFIIFLYRNVFYILLLMNQKFLENVGDFKYFKLYFGIQIKDQLKGENQLEGEIVVWSSLVDVNLVMEFFVFIFQCMDIKVKVKVVVMVIYIIVEVISKAEVLVKEIRGCIKGDNKKEVFLDSFVVDFEDEFIIQVFEIVVMLLIFLKRKVKRK